MWKMGRRAGGPGRMPLQTLWTRVDRAVSDILDHTTFAELDRHWREAQTRYVPSWDI